jgi:hypothetical protein
VPIRRGRQRDRRLLHRRLRPHGGVVHRPLAADVDHGERQDVRGSVRTHRPERTHPTWATRTSTTARSACRPRQLPGGNKGLNREPGGTLNSMTTGGQELLLPHRRDRFGDRSGRRGRQQDRQLRLQPPRRPSPGPDQRTGRPALPLRWQLPGPHKASTTSRPATTTPTSAASPSPTPRAGRRTPASTPRATRSTASTRAG